MSATTTKIPTPGSPAVGSSPSGGRLYWAIADMWTMTKRNLIGYTRVPEAVFFSSVQPIMFVLLFRYVFGGAIPTPGYHYVQFLMPGIFVQTVAFGSIGTSIGLAEDLQKGLIERFRALPMSRWAVLAGRTTADLFRNLFVMALMTAVGYAVGYRIGTNVGEYLAGILLLLLFAYALSWGFAFVGLSAPNSETAQLMSFPVLFPLTFASSAFVPLQTMPGWLQGFAKHQPVSVVCNAARDLMSGLPKPDLVFPPFTSIVSNGPMNSTVFWAIVWSLGILAVLAPVSVRRYRRRAF
ncbi:MAG: ABC transporter permease [Acidimicrobiales bacterium]|jgi:ABC-2 type transport system permease protein